MNGRNKYASTGRGAFALVGFIFAVSGWAGQAPPVFWTGMFFFAVGIAELAITSWQKSRPV